MSTRFQTVLALLAALAWPAAADAAGKANVAALQVGLRAHGLYAGPVDGVPGPATEQAVRVLQRKAGLPVDGVVGPATRKALGKRGWPELGARELRTGLVGWDVATVQFQLACRGFPSGPLDGVFGERTESALRRFQAWAGITADGLVGPATRAALRAAPASSPVSFAAPVPVAPTGGYGPRGDRFHAGLDFPAPAGTPVAAGAAGNVTYAGWHTGGWGFLVTVAYGAGVRAMYAHLSRVDVRVGDRVAAGTTLGLVGSSGRSSGPHLHLEVRLRGAAIDPASALAPR